MINASTLDSYSGCKGELYSGKSIPKNYDSLILEHNSSFVETIKFNNLYNRLICFDSTQAHGVNSFHTSVEPRLTQVFFVFELESTIEPPIIRQSKFL